MVNVRCFIRMRWQKHSTINVGAKSRPECHKACNADWQEAAPKVCGKWMKISQMRSWGRQATRPQKTAPPCCKFLTTSASLPSHSPLTYSALPLDAKDYFLQLHILVEDNSSCHIFSLEETIFLTNKRKKKSTLEVLPLLVWAVCFN